MKKNALTLNQNPKEAHLYQIRKKSHALVNLSYDMNESIIIMP